MDTHILDPFQALSLFKRMLDEVDIHTYVDVICFLGLIFPSLSFLKKGSQFLQFFRHHHALHAEVYFSLK